MKEVFKIDRTKYRIIDLSYTIIPNKDEIGDRPFYTMRSDSLPDGKDTEVVFTHSHVGTHVETAMHFYREGSTITDFPLATFMGEALLLNIDVRTKEGKELDRKYLEEHLGEFIQDGDIVVLRNELNTKDLNISHSSDSLPCFVPQAAKFFIENRVKMVVMGRVKFGASIELGKKFEGQLHRNNIPILEMPANLNRIRKKRFFLMALPIKAKGLGSSWTRAIAIERR